MFANVVSGKRPACVSYHFAFTVYNWHDTFNLGISYHTPIVMQSNLKQEILVDCTLCHGTSMKYSSYSNYTLYSFLDSICEMLQYHFKA